jgi:hypothetical protein
LFRGKSVLEVGSGTGILGISIAAALQKETQEEEKGEEEEEENEGPDRLADSVTRFVLTDFDGHHNLSLKCSGGGGGGDNDDDEDDDDNARAAPTGTVMSNLAYNVFLNCRHLMPCLKESGAGAGVGVGVGKKKKRVEVEVQTLDWVRPTEPLAWRPVRSTSTPAVADEEGGQGPCSKPDRSPDLELDIMSSTSWAAPTPVDVRPAQVVIGTELVYTPGSAHLLLSVLQRWLRKDEDNTDGEPSAFYLLQNTQRHDMSTFLSTAGEYGFDCTEVLPGTGTASKGPNSAGALLPEYFKGDGTIGPDEHGLYRMYMLRWKTLD